MHSVRSKRTRRVIPRRQFTDAEKIAIAEEHIDAVYNLLERPREEQFIPVVQTERRQVKHDRRKK